VTLQIQLLLANIRHILDISLIFCVGKTLWQTFVKSLYNPCRFLVYFKFCNLFECYYSIMLQGLRSLIFCIDKSPESIMKKIAFSWRLEW